MAQPAVVITTLDGQVGAKRPSLGRPLAVVGPATSGSFNLPAGFGRTKRLIDAHTKGAGVEAAAHCLDTYGRQVVFVRCATSNAGAYLDEVAGADGEVSALNVAGFTGTSTPSVSTGPTPDDAYSVQILFITGSVVGVAGTVYQVSLDGGNTWSLAVALDTDTEIDLGIGVTIEFTSGGGETIEPGDLISFTTTAPILASAGTLDTTLDGAGGKSTATIDSGTEPDDDYEVLIQFLSGGVIGVAGITYRESLDDGRNWTAAKALGTATSIVVADSGGVTVDLAAGTVATGDYVAFPTVGPTPNSSDLLAALNALKAYGGDFEIVEIATPLAPATFDTVDTAIQSMAASFGRDCSWIGTTRLPVGDESEATYLASLTAEWSAKATTYGELCAGACEFTSAVSGRSYRRPFSFVVAARQASVSEEVNIADPNLQPLPCTITDTDGNPKHHNETFDPGLDDQRFTVARTWIPGPQGVYPNRSLCFSASGSDFRLHTHRRVFNIAMSVGRAYMTRRLNRAVFVDVDSGYITETDAKEIELGMLNALAAAGLVRRKASGVTFALSRDDDLLSGEPLTCDMRIIPLAYPEGVSLTIGFKNPALQTVQV